VEFLLCFLSLRKPTLFIKQVSRFLSRKSGRYKSTLCKLYQISHILEAAGILERSNIPGEITIISRFFAPIDINIPEEGVSPFAINSLLNREKPEEMRILQKCRNDFLAEVEKSGRGRTVAIRHRR
jgi:hypothetical protein